MLIQMVVVYMNNAQPAVEAFSYENPAAQVSVRLNDPQPLQHQSCATDSPSFSLLIVRLHDTE